MVSDRKSDSALKELRAFGLKFPKAHTKSPWEGHLDLAVNDKTFAYLSVEGEPFKISCKLPVSNAAALMLPFTEPTGYGLGKSGWVTAHAEGADLPLDIFKAWIEESYRAQAPKKLVAMLDGENGSDGAAKKTTKAKTRASAAKKPRQKAPSSRSR